MSREWNKIRDSVINRVAHSADFKQTRRPRIGVHLTEPPPPGRFKVSGIKLYKGFTHKSTIHARIWYGIETRPIKFNWAMEDKDLWF
jgi:hypothetical protein